MAERLTERQAAGVAALEGVLSEYADVFGPVDDDMEGPDDGRLYSAEQLARMPSKQNMVMSEWIVVTSWASMDPDGDPYTSAFSSPRMPAHHRVGLLMVWADAWRR